MTVRLIKFARIETLRNENEHTRHEKSIGTVVDVFHEELHHETKRATHRTIAYSVKTALQMQFRLIPIGRYLTVSTFGLW